MSQAPTAWVAADAPIYRLRDRKRTGFMLAVGLVCVMAAAEVLFLNYVAGPDSVAMMMAAEGVAATD
ncbi:MAG TPA: hypothetical protein VH855_24745 [Acetobacteraceae bacterium]